MKTFEIKETIEVKGEYDVIVAGGGVAGAAAAVSARRMGKSVLLIEKAINLGGLATVGLINLFVPMCNGRGVQIIKGMCQEFVDLSIKYGFDTVPSDWVDRNPPKDTKQRYVTKYSVPIFIMVLTELMQKEGVELLFDTVVSKPIMENGECKGVIVENKSGREIYMCKMLVDTTGDADVLYRAGVPTVDRGNYHTYFGYGASVESCKKAAENEDMRYLGVMCSSPNCNATLYGDHQPEGKRLWNGTDVRDITQYVIEGQTEILNRIKNDDRKKREIFQIPTMVQFRTTRRIDGDYTLTTDDVYKHFDDSIGAINDFDNKDYLYEMPYRTLVRTGFSNMITAGRSASGTGYAWDVMRVIPPAIITGQAAGVACALAIDSGKAIYDVDVKKLQEVLAGQDVMIHFDDALINTDDEDKKVDVGHI